MVRKKVEGHLSDAHTVVSPLQLLTGGLSIAHASCGYAPFPAAVSALSYSSGGRKPVPAQTARAVPGAAGVSG